MAEMMLPPAPPNMTYKVEKLNPLANHLAFRVDDLAGTRKQLEDAGLEVLGSGANGQMWVQDPTGHIVEFIEPGTAGDPDER